MPALTKDRNTKERDNRNHNAPVAAAVKIYTGALIAYDANGDVTPGAVATTLIGAGRAAVTVDNSSGLAGDKTIEFDKGVFQYANSAAADEITRSEIGDNCYIVDDQTVAKTDGTASRSIAGKIIDVESTGVWVKFD